ncbi:hypothetical protein HDV00_007343 [Rhizophlyctis rosea]|nr:hypothetical protein HDV00_007343 [Rhizophlyctis rosea]
MVIEPFDAVLLHNAVVTLHSEGLPPIVKAVSQSLPPNLVFDISLDHSGWIPASLPYPTKQICKFLVWRAIGRVVASRVFTPSAQQQRPLDAKSLVGDMVLSLRQTFPRLSHVTTEPLDLLAKQCIKVHDMLPRDAEAVFPAIGSRFDENTMQRLDEDDRADRVVPVFPGLVVGSGEVVYKCKVLGMNLGFGCM